MTATLAAPAVDRLRAGFRDHLIQPGDQTYDSARAVFNAMIDRRLTLPSSDATTLPWANPTQVVPVRLGRHAVTGQGSRSRTRS